MSTGISDRVAAVSESATLAITQKAKEMRARGEPVIGFGAGEPDFPAPDHVIEAAAAACGDPASHKYSPIPGLPELREAVASTTRAYSGFEASAANVVVTPGGKGAVYTTFQVLLDPGDEVLLPAPYWVTYPEAIAMAGASVVPVPTTIESGFRATVDDLERARTERTKLLVFVSPSNPSGAVYPPGQMAEIGRWAAENGIWVMTDEIYDRLVFGDAEFASLPVVAPEAAERCVIVNGVSKTFAMTGWRVGWLIAPVEVAKAATRFQSHVSSNVANVSQRAALAALTGPMEVVEAMRLAFERRCETMYRMLSEIPGLTAIKPEGAFYAFPSVEGQLGRPLPGAARPQTSMELAAALLEEAKIVVVPGEAFGLPGYVRLSFALADADLEEGLRRWRDVASR